MENSWLINGGSTITPATAGASSPLSAPPNQEEANLGGSCYPHFAPDSKFTVHGKTQEPLFQGIWNSNLSVSSTGKLGCSTLAVLSRPQSQLLPGANESSYPRHSFASERLSGHVVGTQVFPVGARRNHNKERERANNGPVDSSDAMNLRCREFVSDINFRAGNLSSRCLSQPDAVIHDIAPDQSSNLNNDYLTVFCWNTSGRLLLSNTGFMVILCSCHSWPMSVSDFCEHSGFSGVNPGSAVHLENGQTIAQWRKLYLQKLGIRVIEGDSGWSWPQGVSAVRSSASTSHNIVEALLTRDRRIRESRSLSNSYDPNSRVLAEDTMMRERDATAFSNMELKLGQPYQKSQPSRISSFPITSSKLSDTNVSPSTSVYSQQMFHNGTSGREKEDYANLIKGTITAKAGLENHASKSQLEKLRDIGMCHSMPPKERLNVLHKGSGSAKDDINGVGQTECTSEPRQYKYNTNQTCPNNISWNQIGPERVPSGPGNVLFISQAKDDGNGSGPACLYATPDVISRRLHQPPDVHAIADNLSNTLHKTRGIASFERNACATDAAGDVDSMSFPSGNLLQTLRFFPASMGAGREDSGLDQMRLLALRQMSDLSKTQHEVSYVALNQDKNNFWVPSFGKGSHSLNYSTKFMVQKHGSHPRDNQISVRIPLQSSLSDATDISRVPEGGDNILNPTENCMVAHCSDKLLFHERDLSRDKRNEKAEKHISNGNCWQRVAYTNIQGNCSHLAHINKLKETGMLQHGSSSSILNQQMDSSKDHLVPSENPLSVDHKRNLDEKFLKGIIYDSSFWKDVPKKQKVACDVERVEWSAGVLSEDRHKEDQLRDASAKCLTGAVRASAASKEQDMSDISSRSPGCPVTETSVAGSNVAQFASDIGNTGGICNRVADEGSGINKCYASGEALGSEESVEFLREGSSEVSKNQPSHSLLDYLKLIDSMILKKGRSQIPALSLETSSSSKPIKRSSWTVGDREITHPACKNRCLDQLDISWTAVRPRKPAVSLAKEKSNKRNPCELHQNTSEPSGDIREAPRRKKMKSVSVEKTHDFSEEAAGLNKAFSSERANSFWRTQRPIVHGKYGELSCGKVVGDLLKPTKYLSLSMILKKTRRCNLVTDSQPRLTSLKKPLKKHFRRISSNLNPMSRPRNMREKRKTRTVETKRLYEICDEESADIISNSESEDGDETKSGGNLLRKEKHVRVKENRIRCLYELTREEKEGKVPKTSCTMRSEKPTLHEVNGENVPCAVCGSTDSNEVNCLLECCQCRIRVHQACYGVKLPKADWYCRPCKENSRNTVCVLCGYGRGAMTRALQSQTLIKSLLKMCCLDVDQERSLDNNHLSIKADSMPALRPNGAEQSTLDILKSDTNKCIGDINSSDGDIRNIKRLNRLIEGIIDSRKQWVHMVCGLWTPGTRCPNVHTMSAFDVSGVSCLRPSTVCSLCNKPGGSCIKCRVRGCSIQFHPWCAHLKGLLQSEVEGDNNENVGFYGRCLYHAATGCDLKDSKMDESRENKLTCARTKGYKGCKQDGLRHNLYGQPRKKGGCSVPQQQINAWAHINGKKSHLQELSTIPLATMESDCRKAYLRFKEAKGWRHLVVYKSDIHGLGLYTSRFISRGEMVVEYVGEIVGPRVADKREREYESGKKVQYKGACYFFRIDKDHIIDATRKGGIARFVNHSCLPNCVATVISIRSEKKVVFLAEREIYPGEEITYDYKFNDEEDEGKKIPCLCNSNTCRQFLN